MMKPSRLAAGVFCLASGAGAQTAAQLQQQLQELKQQYEEITHTLEQRIAALEQIEKKQAAAERPKEGTVSAAELAKEAAERPSHRMATRSVQTSKGRWHRNPPTTCCGKPI